ncbi:hypothetical protein [Streptomyces sp. NPDC094149]|uniref:hypothetical protein n=1 Tax=Streptomyces sp. NPDC094149 TaxID=3155079 RepID=UPI00331C58B0
MFDVGPSGLNKQTLNKDSGCVGPDLGLNPAPPVGDGPLLVPSRSVFLPSAAQPGPPQPTETGARLQREHVREVARDAFARRIRCCSQAVTAALGRVRIVVG